VPPVKLGIYQPLELPHVLHVQQEPFLTVLQIHANNALLILILPLDIQLALLVLQVPSQKQEAHRVLRVPLELSMIPLRVPVKVVG
jgi:hypothetical protein